MINLFKPHKILTWTYRRPWFDLKDVPVHAPNHKVILSDFLDGFHTDDWPSDRTYEVTFKECLIKGEEYNFETLNALIASLQQRFPGKQFELNNTKKFRSPLKKVYRIYIFDGEWESTYYVALNARVKDVSGTKEIIKLTLRPYFKKWRMRFLPYTDFLRLLILKRKIKRLHKS